MQPERTEDWRTAPPNQIRAADNCGMTEHRLNEQAWFNVAWPVAAALVMNGLIFSLGWNDGTQLTDPGDPPGWLVGAVWVVLFALLGLALWTLQRVGSEPARRGRSRVLILILFCLAYPLYAIATDSWALGLIGNFLTIALALYVIVRVWPASPPAAWLVFPIIPWVSYATFAILN